MWKTKKIPLTFNFFWAPNLCKTKLTLLYSKLIFVLVGDFYPSKQKSQVDYQRPHDHYAARWQECGFSQSVKGCNEF